MANIFLSFLGISISTSLVIILLTIAAPFFNKRYSSKWKYWAWIFLAFRLIIPFDGIDAKAVMDNTLSYIKPQDRLENERSNSDGLLEPDSLLGQRHALPVGIVVEIPAQLTTPIVMRPLESGVPITLLDLISIIWILGGLSFMSLHLISYLHYKRQVQKEGTPIKDARILRQLSDLVQELHIKGAIHPVLYPKAASPLVIGFWEPILVLPDETYSTQQLFFILKHELTHCKRKDIYVKLLLMTANAIHWFNPIIWIMRKEAAIDMELSCDEKVVQDADYGVRKEYAETLMSMLHLQCNKRNSLQTRFYSEKRIIKKRFHNIFIKAGGKYELFLFLCVAFLSLGAHVGCSLAKENTGNLFHLLDIQTALSIHKPAIDASIANESFMGDTLIGDSFISDSFIGDSLMGDSSMDNAMSEILVATEQNYPLESTTMLTLLKEGETEQKQASLIAKDGYSLYLPDNEWKESAADIWTATANGQVQLWVSHFEGESMNQVEESLVRDGYKMSQNLELAKQEKAITYKARLSELDNGTWGIFYCYPVEAEEGWGSELPVIVDTFTIFVHKK